ncbi:MAG: LysM peptidoglycan-binding domain-containing protein [Dehalococcoidia bacterium]
MKRAGVAIAFVLAACLAALSACGGGEEKATPTATASPSASATPRTTPEATPSPTPIRGTYEVQRGDTLSEIADRFGVDMETLAEANDIADPDLIHPGQVLIIPAQTP